MFLLSLVEPVIWGVNGLDQRISDTNAPDFETRQVNGYARRLIVMTRIPEAGRVKTRLIPALGSDGAAAVHAALLQQTLRVAAEHARQVGVELEVRYTGGTPDSVKSYRSDNSANWKEQQGQDLGERMHTAISAALNEQAEAVIVVGTDCPDLSHEVLDRAWRFLETHDVVLGPADDGGYYLIGMSQPDIRLFEGISWGTELVLRQTQDRAQKLKKSVGLLPVLSDVDEPENLVLCRRYENEFADCLPRVCEGLLSVVIPALNEVSQIEETLKPILNHANVEVIIADGGSTDGTLNVAQRSGCRGIAANRGRGRQMNAGAAMSRGGFLLFLHADTRLPQDYLQEILRTLNGGAIAGAFRFRIDHSGWALRCVEWGTNLRAKYLQLPFGDQGLFLRSRDFFRIGGFRNWPLMEDFELCRRLRQYGQIHITTSHIRTSARRWMKLGFWRTSLINQMCIAGFCLGVSTERLAAWYSSCNRIHGDGIRNSFPLRWMMAFGALLLAISFAFRSLIFPRPLPDAVQHRDTLSQMMELNRRTFPEADEMDISKVLELMRGGNYVLVDVRTDAERGVSIIPGAISAHEYERTISEHSGKSVICYCTVGYRSADYAQKLKIRGITVSSFNGSIVAWCQAGRKLTTPDGHETTQVHVYGPQWDLVPPEYQSVRF
jgi:rSAM/selenodomain-associated transferase 2/rSAM/selenodomain-associated transferase 1